jgi:putative endonuclease
MDTMDKKLMKKPYLVYILECSDSSYYTGCTSNIKERLKKHAAGHGSRYVRSRRPFKVVRYEKYWSAEEAYRREAEIKRISRLEKEALIRHSSIS